MRNIKYFIKRSVATIVLLCLATSSLYAQANWKLKKDEDGIKVYTADSDSSAFKSIKVECVVNATFSQLVAFLLDVDKQHDWVYSNKYSQLVKRIAPNEVIFYSEVSVPWPCTNRDYIAHIVVQQPSPQLVTIESHSEPNMVPRKEGKVRVVSSSAHWNVTYVSSNQLKIVYTVQFDPGGSVPAWLINMFVTKGPFQTFQKLKEEVGVPAYQNVHLPFIKD